MPPLPHDPIPEYAETAYCNSLLAFLLNVTSPLRKRLSQNVRRSAVEEDWATNAAADNKNANRRLSAFSPTVLIRVFLINSCPFGGRRYPPVPEHFTPDTMVNCRNQIALKIRVTLLR